MKPMALVGVLLLVLGLAALVYQGITLHESRNRHRHRARACDGGSGEDPATAAGRGGRPSQAAWCSSSPACASRRSARSPAFNAPPAPRVCRFDCSSRGRSSRDTSRSRRPGSRRCQETASRTPSVRAFQSPPDRPPCAGRLAGFHAPACRRPEACARARRRSGLSPPVPRDGALPICEPVCRFLPMSQAPCIDRDRRGQTASRRGRSSRRHASV